jgi:hypothetical protein
VAAFFLAGAFFFTGAFFLAGAFFLVAKTLTPFRDRCDVKAAVMAHHGNSDEHVNTNT